MRVAAIHYGNHDANACIYDGEVKHYFLEERFSRKKHDDCLLYTSPSPRD